MVMTDIPSRIFPLLNCRSQDIVCMVGYMLHVSWDSHCYFVIALPQMNTSRWINIIPLLL